MEVITILLIIVIILGVGMMVLYPPQRLDCSLCPQFNITCGKNISDINISGWLGV
jgi:hypothetical protein